MIRRVAGTGLSPRVRGNRRLIQERIADAGSIPARAGEPEHGPTTPQRRGVYPRACGGTESKSVAQSTLTGLSPRVRGNREQVNQVAAASRSIPARAGEPGVCNHQARHTGVYPRACGGTSMSWTKMTSLAGLSPRVRGNLRHRRDQHARVGSIPARAGEPFRAMSRLLSRSVYPRACGGTREKLFLTQPWTGLSPRVRGNPDCDATPSRPSRSIPARAGEPSGQPGSMPGCPVYPRACGGTLPCLDVRQSGSGLSPRVRGNLSDAAVAGLVGRSIPARAGEPSPP